ncbi:MAG TPA: cell division protein FtsA [Eubacteriaceae bacterium]|nr:cell division protein FtsA [Eubacteriaceae bacterium]
MIESLKEKDIIFALDIGTRNVVGVIGYEEGEKLNIVESCTLQHKTRAMMDGQIHDIQKVAEVIKSVKKDLEQKTGLTLKDVSIAAAGRVLRTVFSEASIDFSEEKRVQKSHIMALEMQGVESAKQMLYDREDSPVDFFCVAYTPVRYKIDGYEMDNLQGHMGKRIEGLILSTFLPKQVIDSLYRSVENAGLAVSNLTLEPISAMNVAIPKELRLLNLALVDIGAGTSDIAITKEGTVASYGMLPIAGDEFTEKLIEEYLVDFKTGEKLKQMDPKEEISVRDILGSDIKITKDKVNEVLEPLLEKIIHQVSEKILELNSQKAPKAVFCVGGGSKLDNLSHRLAEKLGMADNRVILKDLTSVGEEIDIKDPLITGPEYITPIGICMTTLMEQRDNFIQVSVNGKTEKLLNTRQQHVVDAAIKADFSSEHFIVKSGKDVHYKINGENAVARGTMGEPAEILVNGKPANLKTEINNGDEIVLKPGISGCDAVVKVEDLIKDYDKKTLYFGGKLISVKGHVKVNGKMEEEGRFIKKGDEVEIRPVETLQQLAEYLGIEGKDFIYYLNGNLSSPVMKLSDGDKIDLMLPEGAVKGEKKDRDGIRVEVNGKELSLSGKKEYIFINIFNHLDFDIRTGKKNISLMLNGKKASYTDILKDGDKIEITWEE